MLSIEFYIQHGAFFAYYGLSHFSIRCRFSLMKIDAFTLENLHAFWKISSFLSDHEIWYLLRQKTLQIKRIMTKKTLGSKFEKLKSIENWPWQAHPKKTILKKKEL